MISLFNKSKNVININDTYIYIYIVLYTYLNVDEQPKAFICCLKTDMLYKFFDIATYYYFFFCFFHAIFKNSLLTHAIYHLLLFFCVRCTVALLLSLIAYAVQNICSCILTWFSVNEFLRHNISSFIFKCFVHLVLAIDKIKAIS